jgi:hypothetical protein
MDVDDRFAPPPHVNAEGHAYVMEHLARMSPAEFLASMVRAGICAPDGTLTEPYRDDEDLPEAAE